MKEIRLLKGAHPERFDAEGNPAMCVQEYAAYLAGEGHTDHPACVSWVLSRFMIRWNDDLDDEVRQRLRPYAVRQLGTAGDGQDEARSYMALDWLIRTYTPAFLDAAGLTDEAAKLRGLAAIEGTEQAEAAVPVVRAAGDAAWAAARDAAWAAARDAARDAARAAAGAAARDAAGDAAWAAARDAAWNAAWNAAGAAAGAAAWAAARAAAWDALAPTVAVLQESAFALVDRMIDPAGIHDIPSEALLLSEANEKAGVEIA